MNWFNSIPLDKRAHFLGGWAVATTVMPAAGLVVAMLTTFAVAWLKEYIDARGSGTYDPRDAWATFFGGAVGVSLSLFIELAINLYPVIKFFLFQ